MSLLTTLRDTIEKMEKIHQVHIQHGLLYLIMEIVQIYYTMVKRI